jgi:15-cis-phytoene synthase
LTSLSTAKDSAYCADQMRLGDKDRYLSALYVPSDKRRYVMALYALYNEVTRIPHLVTEAALGEIRLLWWCDAVGDLYSGKTADQPILRELNGAIEHGNLEKSVLINLIQASELKLTPLPFASRQQLERYSHHTQGALIYLTSRVLLPIHAGAVAKTARQAGLAITLTKCLREMSYHAARSMVEIPGDILSAHEIEPQDVITGTMTEGIKSVFDEMHSWAHASLGQARDHKDQIPLGAMAAFLPVSILDLYLKTMAANSYNPLRKTPRVSQLRRQWRIMRSAQQGIF